MGCSNSKNTPTVCNSIKSCIRGKSKVDQEKAVVAVRASIKEVFNLFMIIDYLQLKDLVKVGRVSR